MVHRPGEDYQARCGFVIHSIVEQRPVLPDCKSGGSKGQFVEVFSLWVNHGKIKEGRNHGFGDSDC
jgi:hypothetical protein